jgi:hypothetical protein
VKLTVRPDGYEVDTGRSHPLVPITATVAALAMGAVGFLGGGGLAVFGSIGGATGSDGGAEAPGAPNAPTFVAVVPTNTSALVTASAFAGSGADTQDSAAWRIRRTSDDAVVFADTVGDSLTAWRGAGLGASVPLQTDTSYYVDHAHKGAAGGWSAFSPADTFTATAAAFLALKPAWNDTLHIYGFTDTAEAALPNGNEGYLNGTSGGAGNGGADAGFYFNDENRAPHGARLTDFSVDSLLVDSIDAAGMWSPPWVHENIYPPGLSGNAVTTHRLDWDEGNGSGAVASPDRLYFSWSECWEGASSGCGPGIADFQLNSASTKIAFFNVGGSPQLIFQTLFQSQGGQYFLTVLNIPDPDTGCPHLVPNQFAATGDTLPTSGFGGSSGACPNLGNPQIALGEWVNWEFCFDFTNGNSDVTVMWAMNGSIIGYWTGVTVANISNMRLTTTWGGGGNKSGTHSRYYDHFEAYTGSSGSCISP